MIDPAVRLTVPAYQPHRPQIALRRDDDPVVAFGHDVIGPVMHSFATWLKAEIDEMSARLGKPVRPLFMMRDGFLPLRVRSDERRGGKEGVSTCRFRWAPFN